MPNRFQNLKKHFQMFELKLCISYRKKQALIGLLKIISIEKVFACLEQLENFMQNILASERFKFE